MAKPPLLPHTVAIPVAERAHWIPLTANAFSSPLIIPCRANMMRRISRRTSFLQTPQPEPRRVDNISSHWWESCSAFLVEVELLRSVMSVSDSKDLTAGIDASPGASDSEFSCVPVSARENKQSMKRPREARPHGRWPLRAKERCCGVVWRRNSAEGKEREEE